MGTLLAISSNNWFTSWLGLEINLISIIPLILIKSTPIISEASVKYFLTQAFASSILIFTVNLNTFVTKEISIQILEILILTSLLIKAGMAPFHQWFPQVTNKIIWIQCFIIFTWQKIAPIILILRINIKRIILVRILSVITGALGGLNQIKFKLLLTYSSISHGGWIIISSVLSIKVWLNYFLIYCLLSSIVIFRVNYFNIKNISDININSRDITSKKIIVLNIFSLAGLPPFLGFMAKISLILILINNKIYFTALTIIIASVVTLYFYYRIIYSSAINKTPKKIIFLKYSLKINSIIIIIPSSLNILIPVVRILT